MPEITEAERYREERKKRMEKAQKKQSRKSPQAVKIGNTLKRIFTIIISFILCISLLFGILNFFAIPQMTLKAAKFGNKKATIAKYNYYYMSSYRYINNMAQQYDSYRGKGAGKQYTGYDHSKTPMEQTYTGDTSGFDLKEGETATWADYFRVNAMKYLKYYTVYSTLAKDSGLTLTDKEKKDIEEQIETVRKTAEKDDYSLSRYLQKLYGKGVTEKLFKQILEDNQLAANFAKNKQETLAKEVNDADLNNEFENNKNKYTKLSISAFIVKTSDPKLSENASDEEKNKAKEAAKNDAKNKANAYLAKIKNSSTLLEQAKKYDPNIKDSSTNLSNTTISTVTSNFGKEVSVWANSKERKSGDKAVIETEKGFVVVYLVESLAKDESKLVNARHILVKYSDDENKKVNASNATDEQKNAAKSKAEQLLSDYQKNPTEDNFASLATNNSADTGSKNNGGLYENIKQGQMVPTFNDWIFDANRKSGDTGIIQSTYGYHVMYFVGVSNRTAWQVDCATEIAKQKFIDFDTNILGDNGGYKSKENTALIKWSVRQLQSLIKDQNAISKFNNKNSNSTSNKK
ncbi:MAG: peptidylprolyl isomerase [Candidatus Fimenecus sp.]